MSSGRVVAHIVARDEQHRYLDACLRSLWRLGVDAIHVFDDRSSDDTAKVACELDALVTGAGRHDPRFDEDEGALRQCAWDHAVERLDLAPGDWILVPDSDELFVSVHADATARDVLAGELDAAEADGAGSLEVRIPEVFAWDERGPLERLDGWWGSTRGIRAVRYEPGARFATAATRGRRHGNASGSAPRGTARARRARDVAVLHLGYLRERDRNAKRERYRTMRGHNPNHAASITTPPTLAPWAGETPAEFDPMCDEYARRRA